MATKTISLKVEAYEKLRRARRYPAESFSEVVLRATWPEETVTGAQLLRRYRERGPFFLDEELDRIETSRSGLLAQLLEAERVREQVGRYIDRHGWDVAEDDEAWRQYQRQRIEKDYGDEEW